MSSFYKERFFDTHVRINLDMLRTRRREAILLEACLRAGQRFVVDNTNPTAADRRRYVVPARGRRFRLVAYFFDVPLEVALRRNAARPGRRVPDRAVRATHRRLERPTTDEGFHEIHLVGA